ncbi:hypothetical protein J3Q64DRAFT_1613663, partial [Phycomyces blakesleeanus]
RNHGANQLLTTICIFLKINSQYFPSIRGQATIVNMLILATLWYDLRLAGFLITFLKSLQSVVSKFIIHRIF